MAPVDLHSLKQPLSNTSLSNTNRKRHKLSAGVRTDRKRETLCAVPPCWPQNSSTKFQKTSRKQSHGANNESLHSNLYRYTMQNPLAYTSTKLNFTSYLEKLPSTLGNWGFTRNQENVGNESELFMKTFKTCQPIEIENGNINK